MKIVVCDDEPYFLEIISKYCNKYETEQKHPIVLLQFDKGEDVLSYYQMDREIDLFILDIKMKNIDGMKLAEELKKKGTHAEIIFLTSIIEYAPIGYEIGAFRYWMKPLSYKKFENDMMNLREKLEIESTAFLFDKTDFGSEKVQYDDIIYIETNGRKNCVHRRNSFYMSNIKMRDYEEMLDQRFVRCHAGYIVNMKYISNIKGFNIILSNGERIYISKGKKEKFMEAFANYMSGKIKTI